MMRCMERNKRAFYYSLYAGKKRYIDENGNKTSEYEVVYSPPVKLVGNISAAEGRSEVQPFGLNLQYDRVIVVEDADTPIDEYTVLWVDTLPEIAEDGTTDTPYDYIVKRVARSLNGAMIAIGKVSVGG